MCIRQCLHFGGVLDISPILIGPQPYTLITGNNSSVSKGLYRGYGPCGAASALVAPVLDQFWSCRWRGACWPLPVCVSLGVSFGFHQVIVSKRRSRREWFGTSFRAVLKSVASLSAIQRPNFASIFCFHFHSPSLLPKSGPPSF